MATLKALKTRIHTVQSTRKITSAMYMVAAAKFRRAQKHYDISKSYATALTDVAKSLPVSACDESNNPLIRTTDKGSVLVFLIASDRGLCGSFNGQLFRKVKDVCSKLQQDHKTFSILPVGKKAVDFAHTYYPDHLKTTKSQQLHELTYADVPSILSQITTTFTEGNFEQCLMVYNQYSSPLLQIPQKSILLPFHQVLNELTQTENTTSCHFPEFISSEAMFVDSFLEQYLQGMIWSVITQTLAGEYAARMTAMDNATKNCEDMIHSLKLEYNQTRQARITNELIEIISGAEALQKG